MDTLSATTDAAALSIPAKMGKLPEAGRYSATHVG